MVKLGKNNKQNKLNAKDWVRSQEIQQVVDEFAFGHYAKGDNPQYFEGLISISQAYKVWCQTQYIQQTSKGYATSKGSYHISLVEMGGEPIYIEIEQPYVFYRINIYKEEQRYTVQVQDPVKESIKSRIASQALAFGI